MPAHQYVQHDWPPAMWAVMLLALAILVTIGMCLFLLGATRQQRGVSERHAARNAEQPGRVGRAAGPARL